MDRPTGLSVMATQTSPPDGPCVFAIQYGNQTPDRVHPIDRNDGLTCGLSILRPRHHGGWIAPKGQSVMATHTSPPYGQCVFAIQFGDQTPDRVHQSDRHDGLTCGLSILHPRHTTGDGPPNGQPIMATHTLPPDGLCVFAIQFGDQTPDRVHPSDRHDGLTCGLSILRPRHHGGWIAPTGQSVMATDTSPPDGLCVFAIQFGDQTPDRVHPSDRHDGLTCGLSILHLGTTEDG